MLRRLGPFGLPLLAALACLTSAGSSRAGAQWSAMLDVGSAVRRELPTEPVTFPARLDGALFYAAPFASFTANGQLFSGLRRNTRSDVALTGDAASAPWSPTRLRLLIGGGSAGTRLAEGVRRDRAELRGGLAARFLDIDASVTTKRAWFEAGAVTPNATGTSFRLARAFRRGVVSLTGQRMRYADARVVTQETTYVVANFPYHGSFERLESVRRRYEELEAGMEYWVGRVRLDARAGARLAAEGIDLEQSERFSIEVPLVSRLAFVGSAGRRMSAPEQRLPAYRFGSISLRMYNGSEWAHRVETSPRHAPDNSTGPRLELTDDGTLYFRELTAARVEIMGDFTDWNAVELTSAPPSSWRYATALSPGLHQVLMRIDGGPWSPPPGLPTRVDEYDQRVGLLMVTP